MCPGEFRTFLCEVRDSNVLAWENDLYIGPHGSRLEFLSAEAVGTVKHSEINPAVFANLTENYIQNGIRVLNCELSISDFFYFPESYTTQVVCRNVGLSTDDSYELQVNGMFLIFWATLTDSNTFTAYNF